MDKISTIKGRILAYIQENNIKKVDFFQSTGLSDSNFKGKNLLSQPGGDVLVKILTVYQDLSADWLMTGEGEMLKTKCDKNNSNPAILPESSAFTEDKVTKKSAENQTKIAKRVPEGESEISYDPTIGTPYYDVDFIGGFSDIFNDQTIVPACNVLVPGFEKATSWCNVTGHSMEPKINHGDIIALRECTLSDVQYGEIYAVVLDTIRTIKILRKGSTPDSLLYVPINTPDYEEQEFPISRIIKIFEVIGSISKFF